MPMISFVNENKRVPVNAGTNLRQAARGAGISVYGGMWKVLNCRGQGLCGKCLVEVDAQGDASAVSPPTRMEEVQLNGKPASCRLSCQVVVHGNVAVRTHP